MSGGNEAQSEGLNKPVTIYDLHRQAEPVRLRRLPGLAAQAVRLVWAAARGEFLLVTALEAVSGLGLAVSILLGRDLLAAVTAANSPGALPIVLGKIAIVMLASLTVTLLGTIASIRGRVLTELVTEYAQRRILDVTCTLEFRSLGWLGRWRQRDAAAVAVGDA